MVSMIDLNRVSADCSHGVMEPSCVRPASTFANTDVEKYVQPTQLFATKTGIAMRFAKGLLVIATVTPLMAGMSGCASSMIGVHSGSDRVSLADKNQVGGCQSKGKVDVSVLAKVGFI